MTFEAGTLKEIQDWIDHTGFPIVVACWLLFRIEKRLDRIFRILYRIYGGKRPRVAKLEEEETQA